MKTGERLVDALAEDADNSKKRRGQNRRSKHIYLENGAAKAAVEVGGGETSKSFPLPLPSSSPPLREPPSRKISGRKYFTPYLSEEDVEVAVEKGNAFKATFLVNAHNVLEAYCTIKGVPVDVLINGIEAQNRAIVGDAVAIVLDPLTYWTKLKGANANLNANDLLNSTPANDSSSNSGSSQVINVSIHEISDGNSSTEQEEADRALGRICAMIDSYPFKRPTGRVLAILKRSPKRVAVIGFLSVKQSSVDDDRLGKNKNQLEVQAVEWIQLIPTDPRFPKMVINVRTLPDSVKERVKVGDITVERELVAAEIYEWNEESLYPQARVMHVFGRGGEIEPRIAAILLENSICAPKYSPKLRACLPWKIPDEELKSRKDLRNICSFTIDPSSAIDLDDALSVEMVSDEVFRVGVHISDVSYFVLPDTDLDTEAQMRSTSVYILQNKLPMLPPELSENLCSLLPGQDRLAISIIWDINCSGKIINRWIGRSIINSCCKLSYDFVQDVIDNSFDVDELSIDAQLYGHFSLKDVSESLRFLYEISNRLRETRFKDGALQIETSKLGFLFGENGTPYDSVISEKKESCCIVEEFMLLANRSAAEVISQAFPDCALLRRQPEPNPRKLKEFEAFCGKHGFELDTSSSGQLHLTLVKIREKIKSDPVLFDILISSASRTIQSAVYFCTGDLKGRQKEWSHYALSVPLYTHFTSPIRRYPDIIVHRTLRAVLHAEKMYMKQSVGKLEASEIEIGNNCFTGLYFNKHAAESTFGREALSASALKFKVPEVDSVREVAAHCNERMLARRHAEDAGNKLYLWAILKKKETLVSEARVLALGPRFMSVYIQNFAMERRIYYDEVGCLSVDWLEMTGTLVLDLIRSKIHCRRRGPEKFRRFDDVVVLTEPSANVTPAGLSEKSKLEAVVFPLVLRNLSSIPVTLHAIGGDDGPLDIGAKLYMSSYFS